MATQELQRQRRQNKSAQAKLKKKQQMKGEESAHEQYNKCATQVYSIYYILTASD